MLNARHPERLPNRETNNHDDTQTMRGPEMKSVMQHQFSQVPKADIPRSSFDRSHGYKTTFAEGGYLYPIFVDEALPGDTFNCKLTAFARMATPIYPLMDNARMCYYFFAVPHRLIWDNWERFCGAQDNPDDSTDYTVPTLIVNTTFAEGSLGDYFGLPTGVPLDNVNALPFRAYALIWNEWFRDQNLQDSLTINKGDTDTNQSAFPLKKRGKPHDYFTSALPWPQKGDSVDIPLGTQAPVTATLNSNTSLGVINPGTGQLDRVRTEGGTTPNQYAFLSQDGTGANALYADLTNATAATVNQLRQAFQIQKLLERDARGGTRYTEVIRAHFGVTSPDARLQRPEYLGGGKAFINVQPVPQTSETSGSPQGNLAAYATSSIDGIGFNKSFTEHCVIIGLACAVADLTYQQGRNRMWSRSTRYDYYWPALANIGEQAILNEEIYADGSANDQSVFAYQERFAEYRYKPSVITGQFRSNAVTSLDAWHLSQDFASLPTLNSTFIEETPPFDRVVAVPSEPHFLFDAYFNLRCARPMPLYGVPGNIDRF